MSLITQHGLPLYKTKEGFKSSKSRRIGIKIISGFISSIIPSPISITTILFKTPT